MFLLHDGTTTQLQCYTWWGFSQTDHIPKNYFLNVFVQWMHEQDSCKCFSESKSHTLGNLGTMHKCTKARLQSRQDNLESERRASSAVYSQGTDWVEHRWSWKKGGKHNKCRKHNSQIVIKDSKIRQEITWTIKTAKLPKHDNTNWFIIQWVISPWSSSLSKSSVQVVGSSGLWLDTHICAYGKLCIPSGC